VRVTVPKRLVPVGVAVAVRRPRLVSVAGVVDVVLMFVAVLGRPMYVVMLVV